MAESPLFQSLAILLNPFDIISIYIPVDNTCRRKEVDFQRCGSQACEEEELKKLKTVQSKFRCLTQMPDVNKCFEEIKYFVEHTHCSAHLGAVTEALNEWKMAFMSDSGSSHDSQKSGNETSNTPNLSLASDDTVPHRPCLGSTSAFTGKVESVAFTSHTDPTQTQITEKLASLTINQNAHSQSDNGGLSLTAESTTIRSTVIEIDDSSNSESDEVKIVHIQSKTTALGSLSPLRARSAKDDASALFKSAFNSPTDKKMAEGVVYILKSTKDENTFKVGFTSKSVKERLKHPGNCDAKDVEIIYWTKDRFYGAKQAEGLIHAILRPKRLSKACGCKTVHREWFQGPLSMILFTVKMMENFVRIPAYQKYEENGELKWKPTGDAHAMLDFMANFLAGGMRRPQLEQTEAQLADSPAPNTRSAARKARAAAQKTKTSAQEATSPSREPTLLRNFETPSRDPKSLFEVEMPSQGFRTPMTKVQSSQSDFGSPLSPLQNRSAPSRKVESPLELTEPELIRLPSENLGKVARFVGGTIAMASIELGKIAGSVGVMFRESHEAYQERMRQERQGV